MANLSNMLPFFRLTKTEFINELETTNKYIKTKLADMKFSKYIQAHTHSNSITSKCRYHNIEDCNDFIMKNNLQTANNIGTMYTNIVHMNIRSLDKHFGELVAFKTQTNYLFDYIGLSEIGKKNIDSRKALLNNLGYTLHYKLSHLSKGGVGLITKKDEDIKVRYDLVFENTKFAKVSLTTESIWIEKIHTEEKHNFILGVVYRHPGSTKECLEEFTKQLNTIISKIEKENKKVYIIGDLNIDGMRVTENKQVEKFFHMLMNNNYLPLITKPTRVQDTSISIIDHVIINSNVIKSDTKIKSGVLYSSITDHLPVFLSIQENHKITPKVRPMIRIFNEKNKNNFFRLIKNCNWNTFLETTNVNEALGIFYKHYKECPTNAFPLISLSLAKAKQKPWISEELMHKIRKKNKLYKEMSESPTLENKKRFRELRNKVTNQLKREHGAYYQEIINSEKKTLKSLWNIFGKVVNTAKNREKPKIRELKVNNKIINDDQEIADTLNKYFSCIGKKLADKHDNDYNKFKKYLGTEVTESIELRSTTTLEVFEIIGRLKKKSSGADDVHPQLLKHCRKIFSPILAHLYNLCFQHAEYPNLLKIAKVIPLFKKTTEEERQDPGNYRPISILSVINKILEKVIYIRLIRFIVKNDILYKFQFGFRKGHSTTLALMEVVDKIRHNLSLGKK